ncbi:MAG: PAS domain S-box protein [Firmicutes bacterium]|nr:PAS domain S-box protein [Bacillota bacterium]
MKTDFYQAGGQIVGDSSTIERILGINIIGEIGVGIAIVDPKGRVITANQALLTMLGYSELEIRNLNINRLIESDVLVVDNEVSKFSNIIENGGRFQVDQRLPRKDGRTLWARLTVSRIAQEASSLCYFVVTMEDITKWKQTEEALIGEKKRFDELLKSQKLESIGKLAGGIAHDFNNILTGILANIQLAKISYEKGKDISKNLARTEEAVKRAANLLKQLLGFSKDGSPKEATSIAPIIKDTVESSLQGSKVKCEYALPEDLWLIEANPGQLNQVINHLIMNAAQAMPQGGVIQVSAENIQIEDMEVPPLKPGAYVQIIIRDSGVGIPEANLGKIFDPFFTTKERSSGLGLTTSYFIIKRHGGYIKVNSKVGIGTAFEIYLPAALNPPVTRERQKEYQAVNG